MEERPRYWQRGSMARRARRQGQRGRRRAGQADSGLDRLCRARLCEAEPPGLRQHSQRGGRICGADDRIGDCRRRGSGAASAGDHRLPPVDRERAWRRRVSHLVLHLDHLLPAAVRCRQGTKARRLPPLGAARGRGVGGGPRLCATSGGDGRATGAATRDRHARHARVTSFQAPEATEDTESLAARLSSAGIGDRAYRIAITAFAACIPILLLLIAWEIGVAGWPAFREFGAGFLASSTWDPVRGVFGAAPAIYGTLVSSFLALIIATPLALGVADRKSTRLNSSH